MCASCGPRWKRPARSVVTARRPAAASISRKALAGHAMLWSVVAFYLQTELESDWSNCAACLMPQYCLSGINLASASEHHISITYQGAASMSRHLTARSRGQGMLEYGLIMVFVVLV